MAASRLLPDLGIRPLSARSLALSALLGSHPPRLPPRALVALAELFGIAGGTMRTALSRMVTQGEIVTAGGRYALGDRLLERQAVQDAGRTTPTAPWDGTWWLAVVEAEGRSPAERRTVRTLMARHRMGELRPGVWLRPANVSGPDPSDGLLVMRGPLPGHEPGDLARRLWDLDALAGQASRILSAVEEAGAWLADEDPSVLPDTFLVSAAAVRYLHNEPQLPEAIVGPQWPAPALRAAYDALEAAHTRLLSRFLADAGDGAGSLGPVAGRLDGA